MRYKGVIAAGPGNLSMLQQLASAATAGFGASLGRDLYRGAKKNPLLFVILGALLLCFGWRNAFLGIGRSVPYKIFVTFLGSVVMIAFGAAATFVGGSYISIFVSTPEGGPRAWMGAALVLLFSVIGVAWGIKDRRAIKREFMLEEQNLQFLDSIGLEDSGFESDRLRDQQGNVLKLIEQTEDRMVFSVAGRRGLRAAIGLRNGEMISYTGIVKA